MNTRHIAALAALVSIAASGDIQLLSGNLMLPTRSGAFSGTSTEGYAVEHVYFSLDEEEFGQYENDSAALFEDYLAGGFDNAEFYWKRPVNITDSYSKIYVMAVASDDYIMPEGENVYFAGIFVYIDGATGATNYIARAVTTVAPEDLFENATISNIAIGAGSWSVLGGTPLEPPTIACTAFSVAGGVVTATYSISDFSRLGEILENGTAPVRIAQDVAGTVGATTLNATVTATDETASAFTVSFDTPTGWTTLFLFGFGEAE